MLYVMYILYLMNSLSYFTKIMVVSFKEKKEIISIEFKKCQIIILLFIYFNYFCLVANNLGSLAWQK